MLILMLLDARAAELSETVAAMGYLEVRGSYALAEGTPWLLVERARPTLDVYLHDRIKLSATLEASTEQGRYLPGELARSLDEQLGTTDMLQGLLDMNSCSLELERTIDEASDVVGLDRLYADITSPVVDVRVGRQAVNWGSALILNPTDVFSEVILAEPWRERAGVDAARATVPLGETSQVALVAGASDVLADEIDWKGGVRGTVNVGVTDVSVVGFSDGTSHLAGIDLRGEVELGWWLEAGYAVTDDVAAGDLGASAGVDYSFPVGQVLYLAGQLSWDGSGLPPGELDPMARLSGNMGGDDGCSAFGDVPDASGDGVTQGRLYGLGMARWTINDFWQASATALFNLEDGTGFAMPTATYLLGSRFTLNAGAQALVGSGGEFWPDPSDLRVEVPMIGTYDGSGLLPRYTGLVWVRASL